MKKAQISAEFLAILAIVLVIVLFVIGISVSFMQSGQEINESQLALYWSTQANPIRIVQMQGYYYNSYPNLGELALILENTDVKPIKIRNFVLEPYGSETTFSVYANHSTSGSTSGLTFYGYAGPSQTNSLNIDLAPGEQKPIYIRTGLICSNSSLTDLVNTNKFLAYFTIYYDTPYFTGLNFKGLKPIAGKCSYS
jgi:type II secretory pathway pseudopilin PulG